VSPADKESKPLSSRDKILDTAEVLFSRHGFFGVGLREVAGRVGLSKSALFHHFPTKLALYGAVLERLLLWIDSQLESADLPQDSALAELRAWLDVVADLLVQNPTYGPLLFRTLFEANVVSEIEQEHLNSILQRILARAASALRRGVASGQLREISVSHTLQTLIGATLCHFGREAACSAEQARLAKAHLSSLLEHGLAADPLAGRPT
jgi:AcrR family transcriptional regulator